MTDQADNKDTIMMMPKHLYEHAQKIAAMSDEFAQIMQDDFDTIIALTNAIQRACDGQSFTNVVGGCVQTILSVCQHMVNNEQHPTEEQAQVAFELYVQSVCMNLSATAHAGNKQVVKFQ